MNPRLAARRVVVRVSPDPSHLAAVLWAAGYADRSGCGLTLVHHSSDVDGTRVVDDLAARVRGDEPDVDVSHRVTAVPAVPDLVFASREAELVVVGGSPRDERIAFASAVTARARCPVVVVPPGATWDGDDLPVVIGNNGSQLAETAVMSGLALAAALGKDVRVVCCTPHAPVTRLGVPSTAQAALAVTRRCAAHYPEVSLDTRLARSHPVTGLARHARLASVLVLGAGATSDGSTDQRLLQRVPSPVMLTGPLTTTHRRPASDHLGLQDTGQP